MDKNPNPPPDYADHKKYSSIPPKGHESWESWLNRNKGHESWESWLNRNKDNKDILHIYEIIKNFKNVTGKEPSKKPPLDDVNYKSELFNLIYKDIIIKKLKEGIQYNEAVINNVRDKSREYRFESAKVTYDRGIIGNDARLLYEYNKKIEENMKLNATEEANQKIINGNSIFGMRARTFSTC